MQISEIYHDTFVYILIQINPGGEDTPIFIPHSGVFAF